MYTLYLIRKSAKYVHLKQQWPSDKGTTTERKHQQKQSEKSQVYHGGKLMWFVANNML